jgi:prevent-host-death family protein
MERIGIYDARSRLSELVDRVEAGEEVILTRRGQAVVRMVRADEEMRGKVRAAAIARIRALRKRLNLKISRAEIRRAIAKGRAEWHL